MGPTKAYAIAAVAAVFKEPKHFLTLEDGSIVVFRTPPIEFDDQELLDYLPEGMKVVEDVSVQYLVEGDRIIFNKFMIMGSKTVSKGETWPTFITTIKNDVISDEELHKNISNAIERFTDLMYRPLSKGQQLHLYLKVINGVIVDRVELDESQNNAFRNLLFERYKQTNEFAQRMKDLQQYNLSDEYYKKVIRIKTKHFNDVEVSFPTN